MIGETEQEVEGLQPCPFCLTRSGVLITQQIEHVPEAEDACFVRCRHCYAQGPITDREDKAIARWNEGFQRIEHYVNQLGRWAKGRL